MSHLFSLRVLVTVLGPSSLNYIGKTKKAFQNRECTPGNVNKHAGYCLVIMQTSPFPPPARILCPRLVTPHRSLGLAEESLEQPPLPLL